MTTRARGISVPEILRTRAVGLALLIAAISLAVGCVDAGFLAPDNWADILVRCAPTMIVACGVMLVIVTGEIDISVGSQMAVLATVLGLLMSEDRGHVSGWLAIPVVLFLGTATGLLTGILVTWGRVPSVIVTLGLLTALRGTATLLMGGENIAGLPDWLTRLTKQGVLGQPLSVWAAAAVVAATALLIHSLPTGRRLYALGSSRHAAEMAGLSSNRLKLFVFAWTGFLTAVATIVDVPRIPRIEAGIGQEFELLVVTCVVVGGVSVSGGRGELSGVLMAVVLMTMLRPVLTFLDVGETGEKWTKAIQGLFILAAVISDSVLRRRPGGELT